MRLDDDVTLSADVIEALPKDEVMTIGTLAAFAFAFPGTLSYATADLAPGRHVTVCLVFDGATPEVLMHLQELGVNGPDDTIPPDAGVDRGSALQPRHGPRVHGRLTDSRVNIPFPQAARRTCVRRNWSGPHGPD